MKRVIIPSLILLVIFILIIIGLILIKIKIKHIENAIYYSFTNTLECGNEQCPANAVYNISAIPNLSNEIETAKYCVNLVKKITSFQGTIVDPEGLERISPLLHDEVNTQPFGIIWKSDTILWIALRGTETIEEMQKDLDYSQVSIGNGIKVHKGFNDVCNTVIRAIKTAIKENDKSTIVISGHSLGAAVAILLGYYINKDNDINQGNLIIKVYTFAPPRVGNKQFCDEYDNEDNLKLYRYVNTCDIVPTLPLSVLPNFSDITEPYFYNDCGKLIEFTLNWKSILNNHLMGVYITGIYSHI
jgi:hypothetical protein